MDKYVVIGVALQKWEAGSCRIWKRICDTAVDAGQEGSGEGNECVKLADKSRESTRCEFDAGADRCWSLLRLYDET